MRPRDEAAQRYANQERFVRYRPIIERMGYETHYRQGWDDAMAYRETGDLPEYPQMPEDEAPPIGRGVEGLEDDWGRPVGKRKWWQF